MDSATRATAVDWAIRLHDGGLSATEQEALDDWVAHSPAHARALEDARALLGDTGAALTDDPDFTRNLVRRAPLRPSRLIVPVAVVAILSGGVLFATDGLLHLRADVITAGNETPTVTLPDGSRVFLNGKSALAESFTATERRIALLKGEAYFEVTKDSARPFVVEAGAGRIAVTGTAFNVNLVEGGTEVMVTEHSVAITGDASSMQASVAAGHKVFYDGGGVLGAVQPVPSGMETPWRHGRLVFENKPLSAVVTELFRHLPGKVLIARPSVAERRISGSIDISNPQEALESFASIFGVNAVQAGRLVTIIY